MRDIPVIGTRMGGMGAGFISRPFYRRFILDSDFEVAEGYAHIAVGRLCIFSIERVLRCE